MRMKIFNRLVKFIFLNAQYKKQITWYDRLCFTVARLALFVFYVDVRCVVFEGYRALLFNEYVARLILKNSAVCANKMQSKRITKDCYEFTCAVDDWSAYGNVLQWFALLLPTFLRRRAQREGWQEIVDIENGRSKLPHKFSRNSLARKEFEELIVFLKNLQFTEKPNTRWLFAADERGAQ